MDHNRISLLLTGAEKWVNIIPCCENHQQHFSVLLLLMLTLCLLLHVCDRTIIVNCDRPSAKPERGDQLRINLLSADGADPAARNFVVCSVSTRFRINADGEAHIRLSQTSTNTQALLTSISSGTMPWDSDAANTYCSIEQRRRLGGAAGRRASSFAGASFFSLSGAG